MNTTPSNINPAQPHTLGDEVRLLAKITAIMEHEGGIKRLPDSAIEWMATEQGGYAIRMWRAFRNLVDVYDSGLDADLFHERSAR